MHKQFAGPRPETLPVAENQSSVPLDDVLAVEADPSASGGQPAAGLPGVVVGTLVAIDDDGRSRVDFPCNVDREPVAASSTVVLAPSDVGRNVALVFERGDPRRPIVLGVMQETRSSRPPNRGDEQEVQGPTSAINAEIDGQRIVLTADKEIVLRTGKASITLTRAGKILIRGAYVLNRSSGVNRIKGGSVQIN